MKIDKRTKFGRKIKFCIECLKFIRKYWYVWVMIVLAFLILFRSLKHPSEGILEAPRATIPQVVAEEPTIDYYMAEPIRWIRYRGEQLGADNQEIMKMIRIARCESGFNQYAKNPNSTAKGIFQFIDGTWRSNCLEDGNVYNFVDNINCAWKVYQKQGDRPWKASKACWNK
jgi:hypothetical protein